jgi:chromosome segregation ATPase
MKLSCEEDGLADAEDRADQYLQAKIDLETKLKGCQVRLEEEEDLIDEMSKKLKDLDENNVKFKEANENLATDLTKLEKEKNATESHLKNMKEELATVEDMMNRLNKEKKQLQESHQQVMEDLQSEEDKVNNLTKLKAKLEAEGKTLETKMETETKSNVDLERTRRKLEGDLRVATETILDLHQDKDLLEEKMRKNDFASCQLSTKLEDEQSLVAHLQKKIKELQSRIEELEEDLESERNNRAKADKLRMDISDEMELLCERLGESNTNLNEQNDKNKKLENDFVFNKSFDIIVCSPQGGEIDDQK